MLASASEHRGKVASHLFVTKMDTPFYMYMYVLVVVPMPISSKVVLVFGGFLDNFSTFVSEQWYD